MPDNPDLSNPSTFIDLPRPSLLEMPYQRFTSKNINGIDHFEYMGRSQLHKFQQCIKSETFLKGSESLYLYGTSGSGKSHMLAALAYQLVREGKRVFYIPDCLRLVLDPEGTM
jgi:DNA replication protein DnaC